MNAQHAAEAFDAFVGALDYPMFVVTTRSARTATLAGCLVGFASQTSIDPLRFLVGLSRRNHTYQVARSATHLAVHLIARNDIDVARLFGGRTSDDTDKFDLCTWHEGPAQMPIITSALGWFVGSIAERFDVGDHVGHLLEPIAGRIGDSDPANRGANWVTFSDVRDLNPGHPA